AAAGALGQGAGVRGDADDAPQGRARDPDGGRGGTPRLPHGRLARHLGAEGHAGRGDRKAERLDRGRARRSGDAEAPRRSRPGDSAARQADARGARRAPQGRDREVVAAHQGGRHEGRLSMKLYVTPGSPYARMARIVVIEKGLERKVEIVPAQTRTTASPYYRINPSGRVPYLVRDDGVGMEESALICEYLGQLDGKPAFQIPAP